jgi:hypothetical protein
MTAKDKILLQLAESVERQNVLLQNLSEAIGKSVARWLIRADLPNVRNEMREDIYSDLGFRPMEIVDILYPHLGKTARRTKAKAVSERIKK